VLPEAAPLPSVDRISGPVDVNETTALLDGGSAPEEDVQPPQPDEVGNRTKEKTEAIVVAEHLHAGPSNQMNKSGSCNTSQESRASNARARSTAFTVSDGSIEDGIELLPSPMTDGVWRG
jgi:hypothetical protein